MYKRDILFLLHVVFFAIFVSSQDPVYDWSEVTNALEAGIKNHTMPGAVAVVGDDKQILYFKAIGNFTYGEPPPQSDGFNPPMSEYTMFDMASLTKVIVTTTAIMTFYERGELYLDTKVSDPNLLGPDFATYGKEDITVRHLLLHNAGFPPDPIPSWDSLEFGCPESEKQHPEENFSCRDKIHAALMQQKLDYPPGSKYVYSDLSMITAMYVVGHLAKMLNYVSVWDLNPVCMTGAHEPRDPALDQCFFEAYANKYILHRLLMLRSQFRPAPPLWRNCAPTWNDTTYRQEIVQGTVSDENAYALGGIAGHAGLFSTAPDVTQLLHRLMWPSSSRDDYFLNKTTIDYFTRIYNRAQSSRALGWDTNDYELNDYRGCGNLSSETFTHTGYTGTQICCDTVRGIYAVLLTNRCYPFKESTLPLIKIVRRNFSNAVQEAWDNAHPEFVYHSNVAMQDA